jgi:hypothetical protein
MAACLGTLTAIPSDIITIVFIQLDDIVDLQNIMLASVHVWRS